MSLDQALAAPHLRPCFFVAGRVHRFTARVDNADWCLDCGHSELAHDARTGYCGVCSASPAGVAA